MAKKRPPRSAENKPPPAPRPGFLRHLAVLLLLAAAGAAVYYPSLGGPFLFDDSGFISGNPLIRDFSAFFGGAAPSPVNENVDIHFRTRAVAFFTFALNYAAGGLDPAGYRVVNLALHVLNSFLVYWLGLLLFAAVPGRAGAAAPAAAPGAALAGSAAAALLFLCHPMQTQAVAYVSQRFASLCALFCLLSLACYLRARLPSGARCRAWFYAASLLAAVLAMNTKENAFPLPFMIAGAEFLFFSAPLKARLKFLLPLALTALIIPASLMSGGGGRSAAQAVTVSGGGEKAEVRSYALSQPGIVVSYLRLLAWPSGQNVDHDPPLRRAPGLPLLGSLLLLGALAALGVRLALAGGPLRAAAGFGIIWFFAMLSVESSFIPLGDLMFEHRVYLPFAGLALAAGALAASQFLEGRRAVVAAAALLLCFGLGWAARARAAVWASEEALWRDAAVKSPLKARPHYNLGSVLVRQERFAEGAGELELALAAEPENPDNADVYYNLGLARARLEDFPRAEAAFLAALALNPRRDSAWFNLGIVYLKQGKTAQARRQFEAALEANPGHAKARAKLEQLAAAAPGRGPAALSR